MPTQVPSGRATPRMPIGREFLAEELRATRVLLFQLLDNYQFTWHYEMGKVGHECSFCQSLIASSSELYRPACHAPNCPLILTQALRGSTPYRDGGGPLGAVATLILARIKTATP